MEAAETITRYTTSSGIEFYKFPVWAFENHVTNCYLVLGMH